jgi:type IV secretion system protein VirD4
MLDEFPALGRLDFFESALAFMAGYGIKAFLIAQSLNQIEKAYGHNNAILDNCHVRVCFATNDERTARRVSESLGTATELRAMKNYAGHRLSPWLGHLMVSRTETARALLTQGEIMQLPDTDEIVMLAGAHPIRAKKARYYADPRLKKRIDLAPALRCEERPQSSSDWDGMIAQTPGALRKSAVLDEPDSDTGSAEGGVRREPELPEYEEIVPAPVPVRNEFDFEDRRDEDEVGTNRRIASQMRANARRATLDPDDGIDL